MSRHARHFAWKIISVFVALTLAAPVNVFLFAPQIAQAATVLFDDFERVGDHDNNTVGGGWLEEEPNGGADDAKLVDVSGDDHYARLKKKASIIHSIFSESGFLPELSFSWRGDKTDAPGSLQVFVNGSLVLERDIDDPLSCDTPDGEPCLWYPEPPIDLSPYWECGSEGTLLFHTTANNQQKTIGIDNVRVTCEEEDESGSVHAFKYHDLDSDGWWDENENGVWDPENGDDPALNDWQICLISDESGDEDCLLTGEDGDDGWVWWFDADPGWYWMEERISEDQDAEGWYATWPEEGSGYWVWIGDDGTVEYWDEDENEEFEIAGFGNALPPRGSVHALKFYDLDQSGTWDWGEGEMPLPGWEICIETDGFDEGWMEDLWFELSGGELAWCQQTDQSGWVWWFGLPPGWYWLEEDSQENWQQTVPEDGEGYWVYIDDEGNVEYWTEDNEEMVDTAIFGNWIEPVPWVITGYKFHDLNANGVRDCDEWDVCEPGIDGWTVALGRVVDEPNVDGQIPIEIIAMDLTGGSPDCNVNSIPDECDIAGGENPDCNVNGIPDECDADCNVNGVPDDCDVDGGENPDCDECDILNNLNNGRFDIDISGIEPGEYKLFEERRDGWAQTSPPQFSVDSFFDITYSIDFVDQPQPPLATNSFFDVFVELDGSVRITTEDQYVEVPLFGNRETAPPQSEFDDPLNHEVIKIIDTEIVQLELTGNSTDNLSGIHSVTVSGYKVGGEEALNDFPAQSFFDVFYELDCPSVIQRRTEPLPGGDLNPIPIEIVAMSLTSAEPITVQWRTQNWSPSFHGIYCFSASATDNAGNPEQTAFAGPIAYVPVPQISGEQAVTQPISSTSAIISWTTDHPATSRVIYDTVSHAGEPLGDPPNYGYSNSTSEDPNLVTEHVVTVTGLAPGTTYYYRSVSHGSPEAVGEEGNFNTQPDPFAGGGGGASPPNVPQQQPPQPEPEPEEESQPPQESEPEPQPNQLFQWPKYIAPLPETPFVQAPMPETEQPVNPASQDEDQPAQFAQAPSEIPIVEVPAAPEAFTTEVPATQEGASVVPPREEITPRPNLLAAVISAVSPMQWTLFLFVLIASFILGPRVYRLLKTKVQK